MSAGYSQVSDTSGRDGVANPEYIDPHDLPNSFEAAKRKSKVGLFRSRKRKTIKEGAFHRRLKRMKTRRARIGVTYEQTTGSGRAPDFMQDAG
jgi:hypothetical protein